MSMRSARCWPRAREARRVMAAPLHACSGALSRFGEAVEHDEAAQAHLQRALDRLARTLQLLFGARRAASTSAAPLTTRPRARFGIRRGRATRRRLRDRQSLIRRLSALPSPPGYSERLSTTYPFGVT
jgi:hypothetical protein